MPQLLSKSLRLGEARGVAPHALGARGLPETQTLALDRTVLAATILVNLLGLALPLATLQVYDRIVPSEGVATLIALSLVLIGVAIGEFLLRGAQNALLGVAAMRFAQLTQLRGLERVLRGDVADAPRISALMDRFSAIDRLSDYYGGGARLSAVDLPFSIIFLVAIGMIGGVIVLAPIAVFVVFLLISRQIAHQTRQVADAREEQDGRVSDFLSEAFGRAHTIKTLSVEALMMRRYERLMKRTAELHRDAVLAAAETERAPTLFGNLSSIATLCGGALLVMEGSLSVGGLAACSLLAGRAVQPLLRATRSASETEKAAVAADQVAKLFHSEPPPLAATPEVEERAPRVKAWGMRVVRDERVVAHDVTFEVEPGELVFVLDAGGAGGAAMLEQIAGLRASDAGSLRVGGLAPWEYRAAQNGRVTMVSASDMVFPGTILQNLTLFGRGPSVDDALQAADMIGLERRVHALPDGYDTMVVSGAAETMSAGFLQSVLLARALAQKPRLLVVDRPFAYLDAQVANRVASAFQSLRNETTTIALISERKMAHQADQVLVLADGRLESRSPFAFAPERAPDAPEPAAQTPQPQPPRPQAGAEEERVAATRKVS